MKGYVKLVCDDCGGNLASVDGFVPRYCITAPKPLGPDTMIEVQETFARKGIIPILDSGMEIVMIHETLRCGSCGALYEKVDDG